MPRPRDRVRTPRCLDVAHTYALRPPLTPPSPRHVFTALVSHRATFATAGRDRESHHNPPSFFTHSPFKFTVDFLSHIAYSFHLDSSISRRACLQSWAQHSRPDPNLTSNSAWAAQIVHANHNPPLLEILETLVAPMLVVEYVLNFQKKTTQPLNLTAHPL